jgi:hypothetical protein
MALPKNTIVNVGEAKGKFLEGIISGTPKPGVVMQIQAGTALKNGRLTWEVYNADADGDQRLIAVLQEDYLQGKTVTDAYVSGTRGFLYCPIMGEELNMLVAAPGTGTGDEMDIGDLLMVNDGDGILVATTGDPQNEAFIVTEPVDDVVSTGTLVRVMYTGH